MPVSALVYIREVGYTPGSSQRQLLWGHHWIFRLWLGTQLLSTSLLVYFQKFLPQRQLDRV